MAVGCTAATIEEPPPEQTPVVTERSTVPSPTTTTTSTTTTTILTTTTTPPPWTETERFYGPLLPQWVEQGGIGGVCEEFTSGFAVNELAEVLEANADASAVNREIETVHALVLIGILIAKDCPDSYQDFLRDLDIHYDGLTVRNVLEDLGNLSLSGTLPDGVRVPVLTRDAYIEMVRSEILSTSSNLQGWTDQELLTLAQEICEALDTVSIERAMDELATLVQYSIEEQNEIADIFAAAIAHFCPRHS